MSRNANNSNQPLRYTPVCITMLISFLPVKGIIYVKIQSNAVAQGLHTTFECLERGTDDPVPVHSWLKDGRDVQSELGSRQSTFPPPNYHILAITSVQVSDTGTYMCVSDKGENATESLVVYCPIVTYPKPVVRAVVGGNVTLQCDGECYTYIFWFKDNYQVTGLEPERFYSPGNGSALRIRNVTTSDNGTFLCEFVSQKTAYRKVELFVMEPADQVTVSRSNNVADVGHDYEIRCKSNGQPVPGSVSWFNDSKPIHSTTRVSMHYDKETGTATLSINPLTRYDLSKFECRFEQELLKGQVNYVYAAIPITPTDKPDPPTNLHTDFVLNSDFSIRLKVHLFWTPPIYTGNSQMLAYRVAYWDENECQLPLCQKEHWLAGSVVSHQFDLQTYGNRTRLCFSVKSVNKDGLSKPSEKTCVGIRLPAPPLSSPPPSEPKSTTKKVLATTSIVPVATRTFQVALKNEGMLCKGPFQVSEVALTKALASLFDLLCSCSVSTDDVTADSYMQLGDVTYYRGFLQSPQADYILSNLSHHIRHGSDRLRLSGRYVTFLTSCPTRLSDGVCKISSEDCSSLSCTETASTNSPHTDTLQVVNDRQSLSLAGIIVISVLGGLLFISLLVTTWALCYCHRITDISTKVNKSRHKRTPSTQHILHHMNGSIPGSQSHISVSRSSTSSGSHSDVADLEQQTSSKRKLVKHSLYPRGHPSRDSAISDESLRSEVDAYGHYNSNDDVFCIPDKQERARGMKLCCGLYFIVLLLAHPSTTFGQGKIAVVCRSPTGLPESQREVTVKGNDRQTVILDCVNSAGKAITWLKNSRSDSLSCSAKSTARCHIDSNRLTISNVVREDAGSYVCKDRYGNRTSKGFVVHVTTEVIQGAPFIAEAQNLSAKAGENVTVEFSTKNVTFYTFKLHSVKVKTGRGQRFQNHGDGRLTIVNVSQADMGWITLIGRSSWTPAQPAERSLYLTVIVITGGDSIVGNQSHSTPETTVPQVTLPVTAVPTSLQPSDESRGNSTPFLASSKTATTDTLTSQTATLPPTAPYDISSANTTHSVAPTETSPSERGKSSGGKAATANPGILAVIVVVSVLVVGVSFIVLVCCAMRSRKRRKHTISSTEAANEQPGVDQSFPNRQFIEKQTEYNPQQQNPNMLEMIKEVGRDTKQALSVVLEIQDTRNDDVSRSIVLHEETTSTSRGQRTDPDLEAVQHEQDKEHLHLLQDLRKTQLEQSCLLQRVEGMVADSDIPRASCSGGDQFPSGSGSSLQEASRLSDISLKTTKSIKESNN